MKAVKLLSVLLFLFLPILIFLSLSFFGENKFQVPVYYLEKTDTVPTICEMEYHFPYRIPPSSQLNLQGTTVVFFLGKPSEEQRAEWSGVLTAFGQHRSDVACVAVYQAGSLPSLPVGDAVLLDSMAYQLEKQCYYLSAAHNMTLIDGDRRIRGYYNGFLTKDIDRLRVELSILLNNAKKYGA